AGRWRRAAGSRTSARWSRPRSTCSASRASTSRAPPRCSSCWTRAGCSKTRAEGSRRRAPSCGSRSSTPRSGGRMRRAHSVVPALLFAGLLAAGCGHHSAAEDDAAHPARARVVTAPLSLHTFDRAAEGTGQWRSATETPVQAPFDAIVEALAPHPGERVERGATIGRWTTYESEAALQGAQLWREGAADSITAREGERALAQARRSLVRVPIVAPVTGTVVRRSAEPGARLAAGTEVLAIVPDDEVVFEAHLRADDARAVKIGMPATIEDGAGPPLAARVLTLLPAAGGDQTVLAWLR